MTKYLSDYRREYGTIELSETTAQSSPFAQFHIWFEDVAKTDNYDPTAMILSTISDKGYPDSRVVLLKGIIDESFVFYTNYESKKALDLKHNPFVALNFFWPALARQVRIRGKIFKLSQELSDDYFASRPKASQLAAHASDQSQIITSRGELESRMNTLIKTVGDEPVLRPNHWGGYGVKPLEIEFWQGRDNRLHDRLLYTIKNKSWEINRLAP